MFHAGGTSESTINSRGHQQDGHPRRSAQCWNCTGHGHCRAAARRKIHLDSSIGRPTISGEPLVIPPGQLDSLCTASGRASFLSTRYHSGDSAIPSATLLGSEPRSPATNVSELTNLSGICEITSLALGSWTNKTGLRSRAYSTYNETWPVSHRALCNPNSNLHENLIIKRRIAPWTSKDCQVHTPHKSAYQNGRYDVLSAARGVNAVFPDHALQPYGLAKTSILSHTIHSKRGQDIRQY